MQCSYTKNQTPGAQHRTHMVATVRPHVGGLSFVSCSWILSPVLWTVWGWEGESEKEINGKGANTWRERKMVEDGFDFEGYLRWKIGCVAFIWWTTNEAGMFLIFGERVSKACVFWLIMGFGPRASKYIHIYIYIYILLHSLWEVGDSGSQVLERTRSLHYLFIFFSI